VGREAANLSRPPERRIEELLGAAREARERAYAPYSGFNVGAAVLADDGRIFAAPNVENASYGVSLCAERGAVHKAVSEGAGRLEAVAVVASGEGHTWPCGACRQVLYEFGRGDLVVISEAPGGGREQHPLADLLPNAFGPEDLT
jgi:cytidine deaminase